MRTEQQWTDWGDEHPWLAGAAQLGIYLLCWVGFFAGIWLVMGGWALLMHLVGIDA